MKNILLILFILIAITNGFAQKGKTKKDKQAATTGWSYQDATSGGFEMVEYNELRELPKNARKYFDGIVLIEGGTYTSGPVNSVLPGESDTTMFIKQMRNRITVSSFYISDHEVTNAEYREFVQYMTEYTARSVLATKYPEYYVEGTKQIKKHTPIKWDDEVLFGPLYFTDKERQEESNHISSEPVINTARIVYWMSGISDGSGVEIYPDTLCWIKEYPYYGNDPICKVYFWHPAYDNYPVVGVNWFQANAYCKWRTDMLNEAILAGRGINTGEGYFSTDAYLASESKKIEHVSMNNGDTKKADNLLYPNFRLPTQAEWEYAAVSRIRGKSTIESFSFNNAFPWKTKGLVNEKGRFQANFGPIIDRNGMWIKPFGEFDKAGEEAVAEFVYTSPVKSFPANDFKLYDMAGNVAEWTLDVASSKSVNFDVNDYLPFRGNVFNTLVDTLQDSVTVFSSFDQKDHFVLRNGKEYSEIVRQNDSIKLSNTIDADDSNEEAVQKLLWKYQQSGMQAEKFDTSNVYAWKRLSETAQLEIHNARVIKSQSPARIVKGGSWATGPAYMQCGGMEAYNENRGSSRVGFRIAMSRLGSPIAGDQKK